MAKGSRGGKRSSSRFGRLTVLQHEYMINDSKNMWGNDIDKQRGFVGTSNSWRINEKLRNLPADVDLNKTDLGGNFWDNNAVVQNMDMLTSKPLPLTKGIIMVRNVDDTWLQNSFGTSDLNVLLDKNLIGQTFSEKGFICCSTVPSENVFRHRPIQWEIETPKGTRGFVPNNADESEVTLPRNSVFKITGSEKRNGQYVLRVRIVNTPNNARGFSKKNITT